LLLPFKFDFLIRLLSGNEKDKDIFKEQKKIFLRLLIVVYNYETAAVEVLVLMRTDWNPTEKGNTTQKIKIIPLISILQTFNDH